MNFKNELGLAFQLFEEKKLNESKKLYEKILENQLTLEEEIQLRYGYGYPLSELGLVEEAIQNYSELEKGGREIKNKEIISQAIHQIGMVYRQNKKYEKALDKFYEEKNFIKEHFEDNLLFIAANNYEIGYTHFLRNNYEEAYNFLKQSLKIANQTEDLIMIASSQRALGEYYSKQNNYSKSIEYFEESIRNFEKASDYLGVSEVKQIIDSLWSD